MNHPGTIPLRTDRLLLRPLEMTDARAYAAVWAEAPVVWEPPFSDEQTVGLRKRIARLDHPYVYDWGIVLQAVGTLIGEIFTVRHDENTLSCEIAYGIAREHRDHGYASEALARVLPFLLLEAGYNRVQAGHLADNPASGRVMEKAGMKYEGTLRQDNRNRAGVLTDSRIYSMIRGDIAGSPAKPG